MTSCYGYIRVSSRGQLDGDGPERQEQAIKAYAASHGLEVVGTYQDSITGTTETRPKLAEMLVALEANGQGIKTVIIERLDRLARDLLVQEAIIRDFRRLGIALVSTCEGPDLMDNDPTRKLVRQVLGAIAEYEKQMIVLKLRAARERKRAKTGKCEGQKGYPIEFRKRLLTLTENLTLEQTAQTLNAEGSKTLKGHPWTAKAVGNAIYWKG